MIQTVNCLIHNIIIKLVTPRKGLTYTLKRKKEHTMANIKITPEMLKGKSNELRGLKTEHEAVMARITNLVNSLGEQWSGDAQQAFQQSYQGMAPTFQKFVEILEGYSKLMDKAAQDMESTDQSIKASIQSFS